MNKYSIEAIGTFFLLLTGALAGNPLAVGAILTAMIYMGGYISGAHYNPAVTVAALIRGAIDRDTALRYVIAQIGGAMLAAVTYSFIKGSIFSVRPAVGTPAVAIFLSEFLFTFALASVVLHVATVAKHKENNYYGLAIGFTVLAGAYAVGPISGGVFNPAVALGPALVDFASIQGAYASLVTYLAAQLSAGVVAGIVFKKIHNKNS